MNKKYFLFSQYSIHFIYITMFILIIYFYAMYGSNNNTYATLSHPKSNSSFELKPIQIIKIIDGDTFKVKSLCNHHRTENVRLIGIDCMEKSFFNSSSHKHVKKQAKYYHISEKDVLKRGQAIIHEVELILSQYDSFAMSTHGKGYYGRLLVKIWGYQEKKKVLINQLLINKVQGCEPY